jgi:hypothetical protein
LLEVGALPVATRSDQPVTTADRGGEHAKIEPRAVNRRQRAPRWHASPGKRRMHQEMQRFHPFVSLRPLGGNVAFGPWRPTAWRIVDRYGDDLDHPGGLSVLGDYLFVPLQRADHYDLPARTVVLDMSNPPDVSGVFDMQLEDGGVDLTYFPSDGSRG